jgi:hypothetical protein
MSPESRRDLLIGGPVVFVGVLLLSFAFFGDDDGFRAPRWLVGLISIACIFAGAVPLRSLLDPEGRPSTRLGALAAMIIFIVIALVSVWVMVAVGPEGTSVTFDVPLPLSDNAEHWLKAILFYGLLGVVALLCLVGAAATYRTALPPPGRTVKVAFVALLVGLAGWIAIESQREAQGPRAPVVHLSFDRRFPTDNYPAHAIGRELLALPGRRGTGLFLGGNGDFLDVDIPGSYDTANGLSLSFWMKRENWLNPYLKGSRMQTVAVIELERERHGRPEVLQAMFYLQVTLPRERAGETVKSPEEYHFRPRGRIADVELAAPRALMIPAGRWVHVALVYDRFVIDRLRLYLDGKLVARAAPWGSGLGYADLRTMRIGTWSERNGAYRGMIDEVKVYARALSDEEIAADAAVEGK